MGHTKSLVQMITCCVQLSPADLVVPDVVQDEIGGDSVPGGAKQLERFAEVRSWIFAETNMDVRPDHVETRGEVRLRLALRNCQSLVCKLQSSLKLTFATTGNGENVQSLRHETLVPRSSACSQAIMRTGKRFTEVGREAGEEISGDNKGVASQCRFC